MNILTILNSLILIYLVYKQLNYKITIDKNKTFLNHTVLGYNIMLWKKINDNSSSGKSIMYIPIKNAKKVELQEEIHRLISSSEQNRLQTLSAKFSWLKTIEQVKQFEKDYSVADRKIVENLVSNFFKKL